MEGILIIDKPKGMTSHDVVSKVKRKLGASKVGHLGTLDPNATGVLPLVINKATKSARFIEGKRKGYLAVMELGITTDTFDVEGEVVEKRPLEGITETAVRQAVANYVGTISQVPPMYSAVKKGGVPLYKLARKGVVVEREPKEITIDKIEVTSMELPIVVMNIICSRGTYIRTLCHDIGEELGCGAHLKDLQRTESAGFRLDESVAIDADSMTMRAAILPVREGLKRLYKEIEIDANDAQKISRGATLLGVTNSPSLKDKEMVLLQAGLELVALAEFSGEGIFKIVNAFNRARGGEKTKLCANSKRSH